MIRRTHLSDELAEQLLTGRTTTAADPLGAFFEDVRANARSDARPTRALAVLLAEGFSDDKGDLSVTAASNVTGPAPQVSGLPTRRKNRMIETLLAKAAAMTLGVKLAAGAGAVALAGTTAAATGNLPQLPTQATERVEVQEGSDIVLDTEADTDVVENGDGPPEGTFGAVVQGLREDHEGADFGAAVSEAAKAMGQEKAAEGRATGEEASEAGQANRPETTPTADDNPGTTARTENQPDPVPTADDNPGSGARDGAGEEKQDDAGSQAPAGAGPEASDDAGAEGGDAAEEGTSRRP